MASIPSPHQWFLSPPKRLQMFMYEHHLMDGTSALGILLIKLFTILSTVFPFPLHPNKSCPHYVIPAPLIKHINNHFMSQVLKAMHHLILFTLMCGVLLVILVLMDPDIILFLWIIILNIHGFIQWSQNQVSLPFSHFLKRLWKIVFKKLSKHCILIMVENSLL